MPFHGGPLTTSIVKMHGDLRHEEHMTVSKADYGKYLEDYPVIATHLSAMLITRTALFVGYSLSDPDFQHIREVVRSRLGKFERMSYLIQFDVAVADVEELLSDNLHVVSVAIGPKSSSDNALAELFQAIQEDLDIRQGARFRAARPEVFEQVTEETLEATSRATDASSLFTSSSNLCFVMMPIRPELDAVYRKLIKPAAERFGLTVLRADEMYAPAAIPEQIRVAIRQARLCIVDVSGQNPNVLYEVGMAHTLGKPTVLITERTSDIPFDISSIRFIVYDPNSVETARPALERSIQHVLSEGRLDEAERLIDVGMYRSAVAMLGVLLEHSLRQLSARYADITGGALGRRRLNLAQSLRLLAESRIIRTEDSALLSECVAMRNRAVHELEEPKAKDALLMLALVKEFVEKYLGPEFLAENQSDA